jgi:ABC-type Fe3+/spermidine/putrescine transport system ATPase subunit
MTGPRGQAEPALTCRGVTIGYGSATVVADLDLTVARGEMLALLGPSGCGKTTILAALAGFLPIRAGEIRIGGRAVADAHHHLAPERRDVGVVFQGYALWPHMDALDTVAYPIRRRGVGTAEARRLAGAVLERLGIAQLANRRPAELSGGEQQRVGLGRALAREAGVYLFDEPTAHLDATLRERLQLEIADQRRRAGAAAIYATHDTAEALAIADRVALLRAGRLVQEGTPAEVYGRPVDPWAARLTGLASIIDVRLIGGGGGPSGGGDGGDGGGPSGGPGHGGPSGGPAGGPVPIEVAGTPQLTTIASAGATAAGEVRVIVRPDWARLGGSIPGTVETVAFRGAHTDYRLTTPAGTVELRVGGPPTVTPGDVVGWSLDRAWVPATPIDRSAAGETA